MSKRSDISGERRRGRRRPGGNASVIVDTGGYAVPIVCEIRDESEAGLRLNVPDGFFVPDWFQLVIKAGDRPRAAMVVWRRGSLIGVAWV